MDNIIFHPKRPADPNLRHKSCVRLWEHGIGTEGVSLAYWLPVLREIGPTWGIQERPEGYEHAFITLTPDPKGGWMVPNGDIAVGARYFEERLERHGLEVFEVEGLYVDRGRHSAPEGRGSGVRFSTHEDWYAFLEPATEVQVREVIKIMVGNHASHLRGGFDWEVIEAETWSRITSGFEVELVTDPIRGTVRMRWMKNDTPVWSWPWFFRRSQVWREAGSTSK